MLFSELLTEFLDLRDEPFPASMTIAEVQVERTERNKRMTILLNEMDEIVDPVLRAAIDVD